MSEWAPSVGGGATTDPQQPTTVDGSRTAHADAEAFAAQLVRRVLQASYDLDPRGVQTQLDVAATLLGLDRCVDEIVVPATREMHRPPATGRHDAARELMATEAIRAWLDRRGSFAPAPRDVGPILLACGPRDRQVVELESLALLLRFRRWPSRVLGARISTFTLTIAAQAADATAVVIMSADGRGLPPASLSVLAMGALGVPVFVTGNAFQQLSSQDRLPGRYLGTSVSGACALLIKSLAPTTPAPAAPITTAPTTTALGHTAAYEKGEQ